VGRITTNDIANKLGLSRGTVSKALNGRDNIDEKTRLTVQRTADEMGYKKANAAREGASPAALKTLSIMLRTNMYSDPYWSAFIKSFEDEAARNDFSYTVNVISAEDEAAQLLPRNFQIAPPAGIVTAGPISDAYYGLVQGSGIPAVYVDTTANRSDADVFGDTLFSCNREYVSTMTAHLIAQGHRKLGFIGGYVNCRSFDERRLGFMEAMAAADLPIPERFVYGARDGEVFESIRPWIASLEEYPTAFVCVNDIRAILAKTSLREEGLDVPSDIALCGYDNAPYLSALFPDLTSVDSRVEYMGKRAMQALAWRLQNPGAPYEVIKITSQIYYRDSTEKYRFGESSR